MMIRWAWFGFVLLFGSAVTYLGCSTPISEEQQTETVADAGEQTVNESVPDSPKETPADNVSEAVNETLPETTPETVQENVAEAVKEESTEKVPEPVVETPTETPPESATSVWPAHDPQNCQALCDGLQQCSRLPSKTAGQDVAACKSRCESKDRNILFRCLAQNKDCTLQSGCERCVVWKDDLGGNPKPCDRIAALAKQCGLSKDQNQTVIDCEMILSGAASGGCMARAELLYWLYVVEQNDCNLAKTAYALGWTP